MEQLSLIYFVILGGISSLCLVSASTCNPKETRPCTCSTPEGVISLQTLMDSQPNQAPLQVSKSGYTYYIAPCNHPITETACLPVSNSLVGCQVQGLNAYGLGSQNHYAVTGDPQKDSVTFMNNFLSPSENVNRIMKLILKCSKDDAVFTFENQTTDNSNVITYTFLLQTKYACLSASSSGSGGLSTGSVLVIIFFVAIIIYLLGGTLFLKYVRKAEGRETIPNYEFWSDFPSLVKDGILFTVRGCKAESTYEKI